MNESEDDIGCAWYGLFRYSSVLSTEDEKNGYVAVFLLCHPPHLKPAISTAGTARLLRKVAVLHNHA